MLCISTTSKCIFLSLTRAIFYENKGVSCEISLEKQANGSNKVHAHDVQCHRFILKNRQLCGISPESVTTWKYFP